MSDLQYSLQFEKLFNKLHLGKIVGEPKRISGGLLHRMYAIETLQGKYAVKALNPKIMNRTEAMKNFIDSEQIANIAANNIPALPAKRFNENFMQKIDNQFYIVFDWIDGKTLKPSEINIEHCKKIGAILANIHMTDFSKLNINNECSHGNEIINWNYYLQKGKENNTVWVKLLLECIERLYNWNAQANKAEKLLALDLVISHRDLDPKNVMWKQNNPIIIDWESAHYINPMKELVETAIYWSESEIEDIDKKRFLAFIDEYKNEYGTLQANWKMVLLSVFSGKLGWLEYSLKRSLLLECTDKEEQKMGTEEVISTIEDIKYYADMIPELEKWLNNEI
ncbi:MAG: aminoglycoside phosphotransferase family protein [Firmicutes bacterium]|nr:aminoglycoside phosphotransferase family protein [Bacillota bacterium]